MTCYGYIRLITDVPVITLTQARELLGWSQAKLADAAGEKVANIFDLENGRNRRPSFALVMRVVAALQRGGLTGIKPEDLFQVDPLAPNEEAGS